MEKKKKRHSFQKFSYPKNIKSVSTKENSGPHKLPYGYILKQPVFKILEKLEKKYIYAQKRFASRKTHILRFPRGKLGSNNVLFFFLTLKNFRFLFLSLYIYIYRYIYTYNICISTAIERERKRQSERGKRLALV